jgi:pimeloyl-ACP methyl ester carboxylesterase
MLARALRLNRYAVLGHSFGAFVALQNAVDYQGMAAQTIVSSGVASMRWLEAVEPNLLSFEPAVAPATGSRLLGEGTRVRTPEEFAS